MFLRIDGEYGSQVAFLSNASCICTPQNVFGGILEGACPSVRVFTCVQNTSNFVSRTPFTVLLLLY